jgi:hypothetical protein
MMKAETMKMRLEEFEGKEFRAILGTPCPVIQSSVMLPMFDLSPV